jgi:cysteinyl-tRNA synthetase
MRGLFYFTKLEASVTMREITVYNTMTRQKEVFNPVTPGEAKMYVCGVTPYNHPHIGNARPFVTWDVIRRYMKHVGYKVTYVQNFTDVDDKIINTSNGEGVSWDTIANRYIDSYFEVMDALGVQRADIYPRVSTHIDDIIAMIQTLIDKGYAYELDGDVYYSVEKFEHYGELSGRTLDDMEAGARIEVDGRKKNPMDFALWKAAKPGEPYWESPWGNGRPGWHIECSAMSQKYLGTEFDFHGGGSDLIFPHHENEIAQSEGCSGQHPAVRYWLHNGFITINSEKMSKSLNNFFLVKDILEQYSPDALRYFLLSTHYRSPLDFSDERLEEANKSLERLSTAIENLLYLEKCEPGSCDEAQRLLEKAKAYEEEFEDAMSDDFNTALATSSMFGLAKEINIYYQAVTSREGVVCQEAIAEVKRIFKFMTDVIGVLEEAWEGNTGANAAEYEELMQVILSVRQACREQKQWALADCIRDRLAEIGITIEDSPQGARWKKREV